jgi:4-amino-4-deoxy-L-arabinose transferase-like glycosyltransferase
MAKRQSYSGVISKIAWPTLWLAIFGLLFLWRAQNLAAFGLSNDEGAHLMWARLAVDGYPLYSQTQAVQAPLFIESIGWAFRLGGQTVQAGRWVTLAAFGLLAVVLSWLAYKAGNWAGALAALLLTGLSPLIFAYSRLAMAEVPAIAFAAGAVALAALYVERRQQLKFAPRGLPNPRIGPDLAILTKQNCICRVWLLASGLALGLSFIIKALNPFVAAPIGLLLLYRHRATGLNWLASAWKNWPAIALDALLWGLGVCLPLAVVFLIYQPAALYDQLVVFRGDLRAAIPGDFMESWDFFILFVKSHWGFWLLAFGGIMATVLRAGTLRVKFLPAVGKQDNQTPRRVGELTSSRKGSKTQGLINNLASWRPGDFVFYQLTWLAWLMAGMVMLVWHTPLFPHHFIVLLPPLILLGAGLVTNLTDLWSERSHIGVLAGLLLILGGAAFNIPAMMTANQQTAAIVTGGREQQALQLLNAVSHPNDFLMGDSQLLIFMAGRRTPPPLGDVALVAIKAGRQSAANMIKLTETYQAPAVIQWSLRLPWLPEYGTWVEANYLTKQVWDNDHIIYFGRRIPPGETISNAQQARLGDSLVLRGYKLESGAFSPGQILNINLYWQTDAPLAHDYTVFVQLLDSHGALVAGQDSQPLGSHFPTSHWPPNEIITDKISLPLPTDLPAGDYTLVTGMYLLETLERLPVANNADNTIILTTITVQ